jgi:putative ABC transport system permease protein
VRALPTNHQFHTSKRRQSKELQPMNTPAAWFSHFLRDLRLGSRNLSKNVIFAAIAAGSLALGIGGSTAMYSVIYGVVLNPFIYRDVDHLVSVQILDANGRSNYSYYPIDQFLDLAEHSSVFEGVIASTWSDVTWTGDGDPQRLRGNHCTMNTFAVMGVPPLLGRTTMPADAVEGAEPVTILGYKFWQRQFGGDTGVLGRKLRLNGKIRTVIGVMPQRFMWRGADVYLPDVFHRGQDLEGEREVGLLARLKPGVTEAQAEADVRPIIADIQRRNPNDFPKTWRVRLRTFKETFPSGINDALWILFGAVGILLLISCVNVSNLLLSRMETRRKEMSIRASLGASRFRLVSQLISESLVLALCGGLLGIVVAWVGLRGIIAMVPPDTIPDEAQIVLNIPVLWFTLAVSLGTAILVGLAPALQFSGRDIVSPLKEAGRTVSGTIRQRALRAGLVVGEVALSLMLMMGASLMIRTLLSIQSTDLGIQPIHILTVRIPFSNERYRSPERRNAFLQEIARRIVTVPGVTSVGINSGLPPIGNWNMPVQVAGNSQQDSRSVVVDQTNELYPQALGLRLIAGRFFSEQEVNARIHNAVVNQAFVKQFLAGRNPLGVTVHLPRLRTQPANVADDSFQVIGILKDSVNRIATRETSPEIYIPFTVAAMSDRIYVAAKVPPLSLDTAVRKQIYAIDPGQPVTDVRSLESMLDDYVYARPRFNLLLFSVFAGFGLLLSLLGVYGVVSTTVAQRTREIGIRLALGARFHQVIGMVLRMGVKLLGLGIAIGLLGSLASVRVLGRLVRNVSTLDPFSFFAVVVVLFAAGVFASFWPARRAARVDPITALREE